MPKNLNYAHMASASLDVPPRSRSAGEATKQVAPAKFNKPGYGYSWQQKDDKINSYIILPSIEFATFPPCFSITVFQ